MTSEDKRYVINICRILADKMDDSGKVAVEQVISAVRDLEEQLPEQEPVFYPQVDGITPTVVKQEPKTGRWITKDGKEQGYDIGGLKTWYIQIMCSECGFIKTAIEGHTGQYHYCPHCGAKMAQESEEQE